MHSLFQKALEVGKRVRSETKISENTVSIASTAVDLAQRIFGTLSDCTALVIGAGEMASLVAKHLKSRGIGQQIFTNRTFEKAQSLASEFSGHAAPFSELSNLLIETDVIISSTGAPKPILGRKDFESALSERPFRPIFAIDIAVPRDIEPGCDEIDNFYLYNIDNLQGVVDENFGQRRIEAEKAQTIVDYETNAFQVALDAFSVVPLVRALREHAELIRSNEFDRFLSKNKDIPPQFVEAFDQFTRALMAKWLHQPTVTLKEKSSSELSELEAIAKLFGIRTSAVPKTPLVSLNRKEINKA
ncbi:glutamyl-tRNA reductase [bacterium]|nr:glutamyl-tRNA reductase [bacterium]